MSMKTLEEIKKEYPDLTTNGWTYYSRMDNTEVSGGDIATRPKEFEAICNFLNENISHTKTINTDAGSYYYKHVVEDAINHYISNGMFIAAALACGYKMKRSNAPNSKFATSKKSWEPFVNLEGIRGGPRLDDENSSMRELAKTNKKNMTITLYPDFMGYKENGYEVDVEMQGYHAWSSHLMKKIWYKDNHELQDAFDVHWNRLIKEWN